MDCWSAGVIMYYLISGEMPFDQPELEEKIKLVEPEFFGGRWTNVSMSAKQLIRRLLDKSPDLRITAQQSLEQEFFKPLREQKLSFVRGAQLNEDLFRDLIGYRGISQLKKAALNLLVRDCMDRGSQGAATSSAAEIDHNSALEEQIRRLEE